MSDPNWQDPNWEDHNQGTPNTQVQSIKNLNMATSSMPSLNTLLLKEVPLETLWLSP